MSRRRTHSVIARRSLWRSARRTLAFHPALAYTVVLAVGLVGAGATAGWVSRADAARRAWGASREVAVVMREVRAGDVVGAGDVELRRYPDAVVPGDAFTAVPEGRVAIVDLFAGEVLLASRVAPDGVLGAAALLPAATRAMSVPAGPDSLRVDVGARVDVLVALAAFDDETAPAYVVARNAIVIGVTKDAVTIALDERDAPSLAAALANGMVSLALRPPAG